MAINGVRRIREALMMSKAELARKAGLSTLTIDRVLAVPDDANGKYPVALSVRDSNGAESRQNYVLELRWQMAPANTP